MKLQMTITTTIDTETGETSGHIKFDHATAGAIGSLAAAAYITIRRMRDEFFEVHGAEDQRNFNDGWRGVDKPDTGRMSFTRVEPTGGAK